MNFSELNNNAEWEFDKFKDYSDTYQFWMPFFKYGFCYMYETMLTEGRLVYEYNPFYNFRVSKFIDEYGNEFNTYKEWEIKKGNYETDKTLSPVGDIIASPGQLCDFDTTLLQFDLHHPVDIECQYSYDGSVNLILNDNKNIPRLINSRFSAKENNTYEIVDRMGNNDTNIYDDYQFDSDVSLYKMINEIPNIYFDGLSESGNLKVGNYVFYFKYCDADGNETDFAEESGIVTCHVGNINDPYSIRGGIADENSYKAVKFIITNTDINYDYFKIYYSRSTSDSNGIEKVEAYEINKKFMIKDSTTSILITGWEETFAVSLETLNISYNIANCVKAQAQCENRLFFGNITKAEVPYSELTDLSLHFLPFWTNEENLLSGNPKVVQIGTLDDSYSPITKYVNQSGSNAYEYYNAENIYKYTGYWPKEIYRLGIVYILNNNTLSPVFNIRGRNLIPKWKQEYMDDIYADNYTNIPLTNNGARNYITWDTDNTIKGSSYSLENSRGVVRFVPEMDELTTPFDVCGLFVHYDSEEILNRLNKLGIRGFFIVRQKRLQTTLAQACLINTDNVSGIPCIPVKMDGQECSIVESFCDMDFNLTHNFTSKLIKLTDSQTSTNAAICPEYDLNVAMMNSIFTGGELKFSMSIQQPSETFFRNNVSMRMFSPSKYEKLSDDSKFTQVQSADMIGVEDSCPYMTLGDNLKYTAMAGYPEEGFKFAFVGNEYEQYNIENNPNTITRGYFGSFLGIDPNMKQNPCEMIDIHIPGYNKNNMPKYYEIRYNDNSSYFAMSKRYSLNDLITGKQYLDNNFRGDCYICNFTHRMHRNFSDSTNEINNQIIETNTFKANYKPSDSEAMLKINRGDINAVNIGHWITIKVRSNLNLSMRDVDVNYPEEETIYGRPRGFHPLQFASVDGSSKLPESGIINRGLSSTTSDRYNFAQPDIPAIKNNFMTEITYSDIAVNDAFQNGYRVFQSKNRKLYPSNYGSITAMKEFNKKIYVVFEHGVGMIEPNERTQSANSENGSVYINTDVVLPTILMLNTDFGSQWPESVIRTPGGIFGVDTWNKKIWFVNEDEFINISDNVIETFLIDNITLTERELTPEIGLKNVKSHYNSFKQDVLFTFYDNTSGFEEMSWNVCYNMLAKKFITFYSWIPSYSANVSKAYFSFDRNTSKWIAMSWRSMSEGVGIIDNIITEETALNPDYFYTKYDKDTKEYVTYETPVYEYKPKKLNTNWKAECAVFSDITDSIKKKYKVEYSIERDEFRNDMFFDIKTIDGKQYIVFSDYAKSLNDKQNDNPVFNRVEYYKGENINIYVEGNEKYIDDRDTISGLEWLRNKMPGFRLNLYAKVYVAADGTEDYGSEGNSYVLYCSRESQILLTTKYALSNYTTWFYKHGTAGIFNMAEDIKPCRWYDKIHPFEFEFKINTGLTPATFDYINVTSNEVVPESVHINVFGDQYSFNDDKLNGYYRQEATKDFLQYNGCDILFDRSFIKSTPKQRALNTLNPKYFSRKDKSTIFPSYYNRIDEIDEIYDIYQELMKEGRNYQNMSGTEIVHDKRRDEYSYTTHAKVVPIDSIYKQIISKKEYMYMKGNKTNIAGSSYINDIFKKVDNRYLTWNYLTKEYVEIDESKWTESRNGLTYTLNNMFIKENGKYFKLVPAGRLRGNSHYNESIWHIQLPTIKFAQKNETNWNGGYPQINLDKFAISGYDGKKTYPDELSSRGIKVDTDKSGWSSIGEARQKDKAAKIKLRYDGSRLIMVNKIDTLITS